MFFKKVIEGVSRKYFWLYLGAGLVLGLTIFGLNFRAQTGWGNLFLSEDVVYGKNFQATCNHKSDSLALNFSRPEKINDGYPKISVSENFYDFGKIKSGSTVSKTFYISNRGDSALIIKNAYTTCRCATAEFSASEIPPDKTILMTLNFAPQMKGDGGTTIRRGVLFETNDPDRPLQEIWVQATVK